MSKLTTLRDGRRPKIHLGSGAKPSPPLGRPPAGPQKPPNCVPGSRPGHFSDGLSGPPPPDSETAAGPGPNVQRSIDEGLRCWGGAHDGGGGCCDVLLGRLVRARWPLPIDLFDGHRGEPIGVMERGEAGLVLGRSERYWLLMDPRGRIGWTVVSRVLWEVHALPLREVDQ